MFEFLTPSFIFIWLLVVTLIIVAALVLGILSYLKTDERTKPASSLNSEIVAYARVTQTGSILENTGFATITHPSSGVYVYTLTKPEPNNNYTVLTQLYEITNLSDTNAYVTGQTDSEFTITIGRGDNGTSEDVRINVEHAVIVVSSPRNFTNYVPVDPREVQPRSVFLDKSDDVLKFKTVHGTLQVLPNE